MFPAFRSIGPRERAAKVSALWQYAARQAVQYPIGAQPGGQLHVRWRFQPSSPFVTTRWLRHLAIVLVSHGPQLRLAQPLLVRQRAEDRVENLGELRADIGDQESHDEVAVFLE
jgi:hypothetical protein